jgi:DNA-binding GntR family transcriptional regulator
VLDRGSVAHEGPARPLLVDLEYRKTGVVAVNAPLLLPMEIGEGETAHREVYQRLREALLAGQLPPGQPISIRYLAQMLGVSTTPVREALRRLEADRAVVSGANRTLQPYPLLSLADLREIRNIRLALEGLATEEAAGLVKRGRARRARAPVRARWTLPRLRTISTATCSRTGAFIA